MHILFVDMLHFPKQKNKHQDTVGRRYKYAFRVFRMKTTKKGSLEFFQHETHSNTKKLVSMIDDEDFESRFYTS